jgi:hypothetical protein
MRSAREYVSTMRATLTEFQEETTRFMKDHGERPSPTSMAAAERNAFPKPENVVSCCSMGTLLVEFGADHVSAFVKTTTEPIEAIACWTCVRSMLEACSIAAWVLDPTIDAKERVGRMFAYRREGQDELLKFARAAESATADIQHAEKQIEKIESDARAVGIGRVKKKLNATDMIEKMLGEGTTYKMLSAVAHGHIWAVRPLFFKLTGETQGMDGVITRAMTKTVDVKGIAFLGLQTAKALGKPLWHLCQYYGWDRARLETLLESVFDKLEASNHSRFWRPTT